MSCNAATPWSHCRPPISFTLHKQNLGVHERRLGLQQRQLIISAYRSALSSVFFNSLNSDWSSNFQSRHVKSRSRTNASCAMSRNRRVAHDYRRVKIDLGEVPISSIS